MVWVVLVGGFPKAHWAQTMALVWVWNFDHCDQMDGEDWVILVEDHLDPQCMDVVMKVEIQITPWVVILVVVMVMEFWMVELEHLVVLGLRVIL